MKHKSLLSVFIIAIVLTLTSCIDYVQSITYSTGTDIDKILPAVSRFGGGNRSEVKKNVIVRLQLFFENYFGV